MVTESKKSGKDFTFEKLLKQLIKLNSKIIFIIGIYVYLRKSSCNIFFKTFKFSWNFKKASSAGPHFPINSSMNRNERNDLMFVSFHV
jgi:hypothetical protein